MKVIKGEIGYIPLVLIGIFFFGSCQSSEFFPNKEKVKIYGERLQKEEVEELRRQMWGCEKGRDLKECKKQVEAGSIIGFSTTLMLTEEFAQWLVKDLPENQRNKDSFDIAMQTKEQALRKKGNYYECTCPKDSS